MEKNKIRAAMVIAAICIAATAAGYRVYSSSADEIKTNYKLNVKDSDIKSKDNNIKEEAAPESSTKENEEKTINYSLVASNQNVKKTVQIKKPLKKEEQKAKKSSIKSKDNSDSSVMKLKGNYLLKLEEIEKLDKACGLEAAKTTADMNEAQEKRYKLWDDELNSIYSDLRKQLSKDKMAVLEKEEKAWIKQKDANGEEAAKKYEGGTNAAVARTDSLVKDTRDRCYYLVNNFMK